VLWRGGLDLDYLDIVVALVVVVVRFSPGTESFWNRLLLRKPVFT
jgi:hypothetical protein